MSDEEFQILNYISDGKFAKVFKCEHIQTKKTYAIKQYSMNKMRSIRVFEKDSIKYIDGTYFLENELKILLKLKKIDKDSIYFADFVTSFRDNKQKMNLVIEYSEIGSPMTFDEDELIFKLNPNFIIDSKLQLLCLMTQMANSVKLLHDNLICHSDLKVDNFLVFKNKSNEFLIKLIDFNVSIQYVSSNSITKNLFGTLLYTAPECYDSLEGYNPFMADVYSLGICFYILVTQKLPYSFNKVAGLKEFDETVYVSNIINEDIILENNEINVLIKSMIVKNPKERISLCELIDNLKKMH